MTSPLRYNFHMQINQPAPDFNLPDLQGKQHTLSEYRGKIVIVNFWSCECPHSERTDQHLLQLSQKWGDDVMLLWLAANQNESAQSVEDAARSRSLPTVLIDAGYVVADLYEAVTTPHVFVVDVDGILRYRGAVDDVTLRNRKVSRFFLDEVVGTLLNGQSPSLTEMPAYGCTIVREI